MRTAKLHRLETVLWRLLVVFVVFMFIVGMSGIVLITLGFDEAWILLGIDGILRPKAQDLAIAPVTTSGGVFAIGQVAIGALFGTALWAHRALSLICALGVLAIAYLWGSAHFESRRGGVLTIAGVLATPGFFELGTTAYATFPAVLLVLLSALAFTRSNLPRFVRILVTGVLAGLAAATRINCVALLPALLVAGVIAGKGRRRRETVVDAMLSAVLGLIVLYVSFTAYRGLGVVPRGNLEGVSALLSTSHVGGSFLDYPYYLNKWIVIERLSTFPVLLLVTMAGIWALWQDSEPRRQLRLTPWMVLFPFAWLAWGAWVLRAPIPHLRYVFPALAAFGIMCGFAVAGLDAWGRRRDQTVARVAALVLALGLVIAGTGRTVRNLTFGNGNILSWEWSGEVRLTYFTRFRHRQYQQEAADYLRRTTGKRERVLALGLNHELGYLADRDVLNLRVLMKRNLYSPDALPDRMFISPVVGTLLHLQDEGTKWILDNCELEAQFGPYAFYRLTGTYPDDPTILLGRGGKVHSAPHPLAEPYP